MYISKILSIGIVFCASSLAGATTLPSCAKSDDIDGKGTAQFFDNKGWIFESWEYQDTYQFTAADSLSQLVKTLKDREISLILIPTPFRTIKYADNVTSNKDLVTGFSKAKYKQSWNDMILAVRATGANVIDLLPTVERFKPSSRAEDFYYPRDHHWTTSGAEAAAQQVANLIKNFNAGEKLTTYTEKNTISFSSKIELLGSFGEHYFASCRAKPPLMKRFDTKITTSSSSLLGNSKTGIGIFGDSFGQAYPDNNFSSLLENKTQIQTTNFSVSGGGPTVALAGYFADAKVRAQLPPFVVVPFQGWASNNFFDYGQITAALMGCDKKRMIDTVDITTLASVNTFTAKDDSTKQGQRIIHVTTSIPTNYLEVRGKYADGSDLRFEIYRTSADYYKGSRTDFYAILPKAQAVNYATFKVEGNKKFGIKGELCSVS